jgi:glycosyltransferase involved in cell wall biosynthesis
MKKTLVSVVIPAYNEEERLPTLLMALDEQTYNNFEVIVVDNASSDNTSKIARKFGAKLLFEPKRGIIPARDKGFRKSKGEIVARIDADSIPPKDWLEKIVLIFDNDTAISAVTGTAFYYDKGVVLGVFTRVWWLIALLFSRIVMGHHQFVGSNHAVRRDVLKKIKPHTDEKNILEDLDLSCHVSCYGKIKFDISLVIGTSARNLERNPGFFLRDVVRCIKTYFKHHPSHALHKVR